MVLVQSHQSPEFNVVMKFTQSWLSDHLETARSAEELAESLTMLGHEVEDCQDASQELEGFVVGRVLTAVAHPNADRLRVCRVEIGGASPPVELICGAPNARPGILGIFAPTGVVIPSTGLVLKASTIRGVPSNGMLCSERELGLSDEHDTILELQGNWQPGDPAAVALERADPVFTVKIMPNRPDALSVRGLARDLAAAGMGELKTARDPRRPRPVRIACALANRARASNGLSSCLRALFSGCAEWAGAFVAPAASASHRVAPGFEPGGYHQLFNP